MKKTLLTLSLLLASSASIADTQNQIQNLQGYYKTSSAVGYVSNKLKQNKVEFVRLDKAIKDKDPGNSPQSVGSAKDIADGRSIAQTLSNAFSFQAGQMVCVVTRDNAEIAYPVDDSTTSCSTDFSDIHKAMAKKQNGNLVFFTRYGNSSDATYYIEEINADGTEMQSKFLYNSKGTLVGDLVMIKKSGSTYNIEHFSNLGDSDSRTGKVGSISYQWTDGFVVNPGDSSNQSTNVYSFSYLYGTEAKMGNRQTNHYWAIKDQVKMINGSPFVTLVQRYMESEDGANTSHDEYSSDSKDMLLTYNFNNQNRLVGLSPDACMIKQIADGETSITRYQGYFVDKNCIHVPNDLTRFPKQELTRLTDDGGAEKTPSSLRASAVKMKTQVDLSGSNSASAMTNVEYNRMKARYLTALISYQSTLRSIEFWK
ncbi:hypothetical protein [Vibrio sp. HN007]|uniref:hypothetical protein n=1 Tax=Vibrio iocasae TaxID=3098914 RepID=UPI0035D4BBDB